MKIAPKLNSFFKTLPAALFLASFPILAQYPGQVSKTADKKAPPTLRAISVYEWTGELDKPNACRLIPVMVYDGEQMQDATVYLARPEPMALAPEVEYELQLNGHRVELFDVKNAALVEGEWVGLGSPKSFPKAKPTRAKKPQIIDDFGESDRPVLHRKHPQQTTPESKSPDTTDKTTTTSSSPDDPDRPHLHRKPSTDDSTTSTTTPASTDSDRPQLHRKDTTDASTTSTAENNDPDRPKLHRPKKQEEGSVSSTSNIDPDRPRLRRGAGGDFQLEIVPGLKGLPADLNQAVAVSDTAQRPEHIWNYTWANPEDAEKMKDQLEQIARDALGLTPPPPPKPKSKTAAKQLHPKPQPPADPPALGDEIYRVFELTYGSGATLVLTATNNQSGLMQRFVTIIAQPDLYGNPLILLKQVTDPAHLDETPRMRLVDAVDALADNRGELLFELRTTDDRQFALYRILRGSAEKIFASGGNSTASNP